jgi:hypothetical protein
MASKIMTSENIKLQYTLNKAIQTQAISFSSLALIVVGVIVFIKTLKSPYLMPLSLGFLTGVSALEISIGLIFFLRWFLTTDPNPDLGRNPRVLARIGIPFREELSLPHLLLYLCLGN